MIWYGTVQYGTVRYSTLQYNTIQYKTKQYNTIQYNTIQYLDESLLVHTPVCARPPLAGWRGEIQVLYNTVYIKVYYCTIGCVKKYKIYFLKMEIQFSLCLGHTNKSTF